MHLFYNNDMQFVYF